MKQAFKFAVMVVAGLGALGLGGCVHFHDQPLSAEKSGADFSARTLTDVGLKDYLEANRVTGDWPRPAWDFNALTLAAFYYQPSLDVARAHWSVAKAGKTTAAERPNPTLSVVPGYNTTTTVPSPWFVTPSLDIPIETAGKRGYRIAQATQLSEVARRNIAFVAWQVRSSVRRSLVNLDAARATEALLQEQQTIQTENLRLLELQFQAGGISAFELTQARVAADNTRLAWRDAERQSAEARVQLAQAIGVPTHALDGAEFSFDSLHAMPADVLTAEARRQALLNRADILGALAEYAASQSALQLEIAKQYPDIHLSPGYEYDQGDNKWSLGLSVTLPVLNHNQGAIAEAQARRTETAAKFNALQAGVLAEIDLAVTVYHAALQKQADADAMLANLQRQEKASRAMLEAGEISKTELAALQLQFSTTALARQDALTKARQSKGQLEDSLQSPAELLPSAEHSPRAEQAKSAALPSLTRTISLPQVKGGFDLMAVDLAGKRLFLNAEDNNTTEVIDLAVGKLAHTITNMNEPKWVVYRPELHRLYIANGNGTVRVLDSDSFAPQPTIEFKEKANNLRFDTKSHELFVGVGKKFGAIGIVDIRTDAITAEIPLAHFPKQFEVEGNLIYVNVPTANHVAVVDRKKKAVIATWPVTAAKDNVPMGFDRARHRLFIGCTPGKLAVLDSTNGKQVAALDIAAEPDSVYYDAKRRCIYISCGNGSIDVVRQTDADHYEFAGRIPTAKGAATSLFVPELDQLFLAVPQRDGQTAELRVYSVNPN